MAASTQEVLNHHLQAFGEGNLEAILEDYNEDSILCTPDGLLESLNEIKPLFESFFAEFAKPGASFGMDRQNFSKDASEGHNLAKAHPGVVSRLTRLHDKRADEVLLISTDGGRKLADHLQNRLYVFHGGFGEDAVPQIEDMAGPPPRPAHDVLHLPPQLRQGREQNNRVQIALNRGFVADG